MPTATHLSEPGALPTSQESSRAEAGSRAPEVTTRSAEPGSLATEVRPGVPPGAARHDEESRFVEHQVHVAGLVNVARPLIVDRFANAR
jgi:hypothetical protein